MSQNFIDEIIFKNHPERAEEILELPLIQYLKRKTASVGRNSKSRGSFANLYAIYVLVEDYINKGYLDGDKDYKDYEGADFTPLFNRQRELKFGAKLQNHALNHRLNEEFAKFHNGLTPIIRDTEKSKYWFNEELLIFDGINLAKDVIEIIDKYVELKSEIFELFFEKCIELENTYEENPQAAIDFIRDQLQPNIDARIFEIVAFCILKYVYIDKTVLFGFSEESLEEHNLVLYKTGRTNANDGGIDYLLKPLGKIYQVTEDLNFKKYFLDIDKLNKFPITFVIKTKLDEEEIRSRILQDAERQFKDKEVLKRYLDCFEEIINIEKLYNYLNYVIENGHMKELLEELVIQCKVEYNIE
ncbi:restriction endonuclease [Pallidibacillus pasinlerensis]|uniref:Restriction endonuclease n=1 Tax=Pallidibacillus pasinlerensis TaxID=2703818 RepID=A0ABX0ADA2_9BACI|nr:restriction endonuclease [Pallidibacillus pasinlerensis]NCU19057.1 restriction endonuclease [Pallidibacillus pasinlerensis]